MKLGSLTVLTVSVSLHKEPSEFIPVTIVGPVVTTELAIALQEHAVENSCGLGGPSPIGANPFATTGHIDAEALACVPILPNPVLPPREANVEFATYRGFKANNDHVG